uniref:Uncharacterized protein n=1 Tax=Arundo donax TaxID=35708 RepID=A0A0A8ZZE0_ARUDO
MALICVQKTPQRRLSELPCCVAVLHSC